MDNKYTQYIVKAYLDAQKRHVDLTQELENTNAELSALFSEMKVLAYKKGFLDFKESLKQRDGVTKEIGLIIDKIKIGHSTISVDNTRIKGPPPLIFTNTKELQIILFIKWLGLNWESLFIEWECICEKIQISPLECLK